jgi:hypothetical protein
LHQLTPNAIVQISKFICDVTFCGGRSSVEVFAHHYELHYQNKRFIWKGLKLLFTTQLGAYLFICHSLGIVLGLNPQRGINGLAVGMVIGFTAGYLRNRKPIFKERELVH